MTGPRDPFRVDAEAALEALALDFGDDCILGHDGTAFLAHRDGRSGETVTGKTPDELAAAMRTRWSPR